MSAGTKRRKKINSTGNIIIVEKMRDYSNDPVFKKKAEEARIFLKEHGLPESFKKKSK